MKRTKITHSFELIMSILVTPEEGQPVKFGAVDLVIFPAGMNFRGDVHQEVREYYRFGD